MLAIQSGVGVPRVSGARPGHASSVRHLIKRVELIKVESADDIAQIQATLISTSSSSQSYINSICGGAVSMGEQSRSRCSGTHVQWPAFLPVHMG